MEDTGLSIIPEWTVKDVSKKIQQTYDEVAKKFEGKYKIIYSLSVILITQNATTYPGTFSVCWH